MSASDRELLELAAKAAGMDGSWIEYDQSEWVNRSGYYLNPHIKWIPLGDDGDALRLASRLGMLIMIDNDQELSKARQRDAIESVEYWHWRGKQGAEASTRRAIVRTAAAIGRAMP